MRRIIDITRSEALSALVNLRVPSGGRAQPLLLPAADFERLADEFLASDYVIELLPEDLPVTSRLARQPIFTTPEILGVQRRILDRYRAASARASRWCPRRPWAASCWPPGG